ncbi:hypothetical protein IQ272_06300 [Chroococcidiopsidales cyanobacterium LEGE 13417]|uniref:hypothetical protein n=1 Tax=Chroococcidiopsis sp. CCALA 051 TaxID=869949 RepID=UPI0011B26A42|nr:hypothetical protein [Chroococcidiopsis sp. CCALA 051]MBE9015761.1 hypothetical protein [Chroococcidiopsidales cyanobacterium LEGE 13417]
MNTENRSQEKASSQPQGTSIEDLLKKNIIWSMGGMLVLGFVTGFGAYRAILETTGQVTLLKERKEQLETENKLLKGRVEVLEKELFAYRKASEAFITKPKNGDRVAQEIVVEGKISGNLQGKSLWLFLRPYQSQDWYPQGEIIISHDRTWEQSAYIPDRGRFELVVILAGESDRAIFDRYLKTAMSAERYPPLRLSSSIIKLERIVVNR